MMQKFAAFMMLGVLAGLSTGSSVATGQPAKPTLDPDLWPEAKESAVDANALAVADRLLPLLTIEEKVGQMIQADIASITPADLKTYKLGSILAGGNAAPGANLRTTAQAWLDLTDDFYRASLADAGAKHPPIPILFGIDAVHGDAKLKGATIFPHNVGLGAAHDPDLIRRIGEATAAEVAETGIDWTFAPTVAVVRDVRWGRSYESYSESPDLVAQYAPAMVTGLQGARGTPQFMAPGHTLSSVKHFLGDGGTLGGRDQGNTVIPEAELVRVHAAGYAPAFKAGALIVMASYNSWDGTKLHGNHYLLTDILKGRMGFAGFVVGDWNAQEQVLGCTKSDCAAAILAGVDMIMAPDGWKALYENTLAEVRSGQIPQTRIDDAVRRILSVKAAAGLFSRAAPKQRSDTGHFETIGSAAHRAIAREAVRKSLVLLKNENRTLPLDPHMNVLVAGQAADDVGLQSGGWTIDWQADHNTNADFPGATSIYAGIKAAVAAAGGSVALSRDGSFTTKPDVAVVVFGEGPYAEFEGDRETLEFSPQDKSSLALLRRLKKQGVRTVSVFISGRPLWVNPEINASDAFVAAWLPGSEGEGIADVLFKGSDGSLMHDFTGRLSFSWPQTAMPVTFAADDKVTGALFARGFGLSDAVGGTAVAGAAAAAVPLSEDAGIPAHWQAPRGSLFHAQHVTAPWSLFVADGEAEVHVTNTRQDSPHGAVSVTVGPSGAMATWSGNQPGMVRVSGRPADMRPQARDGSEVEFRYRVDRAPQGPVMLGMRCTQALCGTTGGAMLDVTRALQRAPVGAWQTLSVPVACFATGADLSHVEVPFALATAAPFGVTLAEIALKPGSPASTKRCPG